MRARPNTLIGDTSATCHSIFNDGGAKRRSDKDTLISIAMGSTTAVRSPKIVTEMRLIGNGVTITSLAIVIT